MRCNPSGLRVWGLALLAVLATVPALADALSDGRFREEVAAIVRALKPDTEIVPDLDPEQIKVGSRTIALTNLYPRVQDLTGPERRKTIESFLATALSDHGAAACCTPKAYAEVKARLRVQLVPNAVIQENPDLARRAFSETLNVVYVLDEAQRYQYVTRDMIAGWGVDPAVVEAVAVANLAEASGDVPADLMLARDNRSFYILSHAGDDYDAARLLLPKFLEELRKTLKAEAIILSVPTRALLMAWPADSEMRAQFALAATELLREGPYGRSDELFRFDGRSLRTLNAAERAEHGRKPRERPSLQGRSGGGTQ